MHAEVSAPSIVAVIYMKVWIVPSIRQGWFEFHGEEPIRYDDELGWVSGRFLEMEQGAKVPLSVRKVVALKGMAVCHADIVCRYFVVDDKEVK